MARTLEPCCFMLAMVMRSSDRQTHSPRQNTCSWSARGSQLMPSARVFGPWPEHSNPAASCLQWSCALQAEAVDTFFFFACAHLTRGRCCTSNLIAPCFEHVNSTNNAERSQRDRVPAGLRKEKSLSRWPEVAKRASTSARQKAGRERTQVAL